MLKKIYISFALIILLISISSLLSLHNNMLMQDHFTKMKEIDYPKIKELNQIIYEIGINQAQVYKYVLTSEGDLNNVLKSNEKIHNLISNLLKKVNSEANKEAFLQLDQLINNYSKSINKFVNAADDVRQFNVEEIADFVINYGEKIKKFTHTIEKDIFANLATDNMEAHKRLSAAEKLYIGITALSIVIAMLIALAISMNVTKDVQTLIHGTNRIAAGELSFEIAVGKKDEIGMIATAFKTMTENLKKLMREEQKNRREAEAAQRMAEAMRSNLQQQVSELLTVVDAAAQGNLTVSAESYGDDEMSRLSASFNQMVDNLRVLVSQIQQAGFQINTSSTEIVVASDEQVRGSSEQIIQVNATTTAVEELSATARQISENSQSVVFESDNAIKATRKGVNIIETAIDGMNRMRNTVEVTAKKIIGLGERSQRIGNIVKIITDIAEQTNLLALNASIEAARAGEMGKGFAVVADEVGKLAEKSTRATSDISALIAEIQAATNATVLSMESGTKEVEKATELVEETGSVLMNIERAISTATQRAKEISLSTQQQTTGSEQVALAMQTIQEVTKQSSISSKQSSTAARQLQHLVVDLKNAVDRFTLTTSHSYGMKIHKGDPEA